MLKEVPGINTDFLTAKAPLPDSQRSNPSALFLHAMSGRILHPGFRENTEALLPDLTSLVRTLGSPRDEAVLRMRFGLDGDSPETPEAVGKKLGIGRATVQNIQSEAIAKLVQSFTTNPDSIFDTLANFVHMDADTLGAKAGMLCTRGLYYLGRLGSVDWHDGVSNELSRLVRIAYSESLIRTTEDPFLHDSETEAVYRLRDIYGKVIPALPEIGQRNFYLGPVVYLFDFHVV